MNVDAVFAQVNVVLGIAAVGVNKRRGDFSRCGITEIRTVDIRVFRIRVDVVGVFAEARAEMRRVNHFKRDFARA